MWSQFECPGSQRRWRVTDEGIEIEGLGIVTRAWPGDVEQWRHLIIDKADKYGVPALWVAAIMALETGGRPGLCRKNADGSCSTREGMGLMAMLLSTAAHYAGRRVSQQELLHDYELQIDLGSKMIADLQARYDGDFVKAAIAYNAGRIRCGNGRTWEKPHEPCPPTPWGVVMGCLRTSRAINQYCAPSSVVEGQFACPGDYPRVAIAYYNAALENGWGQPGPTRPPRPDPGPAVPPVSRSRMGPVGTLGWLSVGVAAGYGVARWALPRL